MLNNFELLLSDVYQIECHMTNEQMTSTNKSLISMFVSLSRGPIHGPLDVTAARYTD